VDPQRVESSPETEKESEINLYVERLLGLENDLFPAKQRWLMVNQEILSEPLDSMKKVDLFLCKSRYAHSLIEDYVAENRLEANVLYTGHTSQDIGDSGPKDYKVFFHPAGKSPFKNTVAVIETWIRGDGYPGTRLIVTCRDTCLQNVLNNWPGDVFIPKGDGETLVHSVYPNIELSESLPLPEYEHYQKTSGFWICPSEMEGYGHYINEGRAAGAVVITTDAPPMNELVLNTNGFLVPSHRRWKVGDTVSSEMAGITVEDLSKVIEKALSTSEEELIRMGQNARTRYERDTLRLGETLAGIVNS
jgi:glycosyltransferase involved in cell wall biosynthesis